MDRARGLVTSAEGISIVIPAYNEESYLPATLESCRASAAQLESALGLPTEIVVVDNMSTDRTSAIAASFGAKVIRHEIRNISSVRNAGIRAAEFSLIVAIDADCTMEPDGLLKIWQFMARGEHVGGGLGLRVDSPKRFTRVMAALIQAFVASFSGIQGAVFFFWKDDALAFGGFDEARLVAEDSTFAMALRKHGRLKKKKFKLLREVTITTMDRKETTLATLGPLVFKLLRVFGGAKLTQKDLAYWYDPKR